MKKQILNEEIVLIKSKLPRFGAYAMISGMINGAYKPLTIRAMLNQKRKMNPGVLQAAKCLAELVDQGKELPKNIQGYNRQTKIVIPTNAIENENNE